MQGQIIVNSETVCQIPKRIVTADKCRNEAV